MIIVTISCCSIGYNRLNSVIDIINYQSNNIIILLFDVIAYAMGMKEGGKVDFLKFLVGDG